MKVLHVQYEDVTLRALLMLGGKEEVEALCTGVNVSSQTSSGGLV